LLTRKHFIKGLSSTVKPIVYKHGNMTSAWPYRQQKISIHVFSWTFPEHFVEIWTFSTKI